MKAVQRIGMSERDWQAMVVEAARWQGWKTFHQFDSRRSDPGWPDLVLIRPPELLIVELKTDRGRVSAEQDRTLRMLRACGVESHVWKPMDEPFVLARLAKQKESV